ncbi:MAG: hypothetical protein AB8H80_04135 [Planctomycetota bacterium]
MRILITLGIVLALAIAGVIGFVVQRESSRDSAGSNQSLNQSTGMPVATISEGERVNVDANVPTSGHTVVMFSADW